MEWKGPERANLMFLLSNQRNPPKEPKRQTTIGGSDAGCRAHPDFSVTQALCAVSASLVFLWRWYTSITRACELPRCGCRSVSFCAVALVSKAISMRATLNRHDATLALCKEVGDERDAGCCGRVASLQNLPGFDPGLGIGV